MCALADEFGLDVFLEVEPFGEGGLDVDALVGWYWRHGFRGTAAEMVPESDPG